MKVARWTVDGIALCETDPPPLRDGWVRLRVAACGICGSDLHHWRGDRRAELSKVPGHELSGVPLEGPADMPDGLYAVEPRIWCGSCAFCVAGRRELCESGGIVGVTCAGGLAEFVDVPRASLHAVAGSVSPRLASLAEPLAVCVRALDVAGWDLSGRALVLGAGTLGLLSGLLLRDRLGRVAITARYPHQRRAAERLGLQVLDQDLPRAAAELAPDVVIETVGGMADTVETALRVCRPGGRIVILGLFSKPRPLDLRGLLERELVLIGSNTYGTDRRGSEFATAVALLERHRSELEHLQTHEFPLSSVRQAFECAADKASQSIKVNVSMC